MWPNRDEYEAGGGTLTMSPEEELTQVLTTTPDEEFGGKPDILPWHRPDDESISVRCARDPDEDEDEEDDLDYFDDEEDEDEDELDEDEDFDDEEFEDDEEEEDEDEDDF